MSRNAGIYRIMAPALTDAKATPMQAHLAFVALQIQGLSGALKYIREIKARNEQRKAEEE